MEQQPDAKQELDALIKETEKNREDLKKTGKKVENLQSAIETMNRKGQPKPKDAIEIKN
jgi:hypothetical protein